MKKIVQLTSEDAEFIEFAYSLINSARYCSFQKLTEVYSRVFGQRRTVSSCGSCNRQMVLELKEALDKLNKEIVTYTTDEIKDEVQVGESNPSANPPDVKQQEEESLTTGEIITVES